MSISPKLLCLVLFGLFGKVSAQSNTTTCNDPVGAVMIMMDCWTIGEANCTAAGYDPNGIPFRHNGVFRQNGTLQDRSVASVTFILAVVDFEMVVNHVGLVEGVMGENGEAIVSVRYSETGTFTDGANFGLEPSTDYPFGFSYWQWEHALLPVNGNCEVTMWDQTGDNEEQNDSQDAWSAFLANPDILCIVYGVCDETDPPATATPAETPTDDPGDGFEAPTDAPTEDPTTSGVVSRRHLMKAFPGVALAAINFLQD